MFLKARGIAVPCLLRPDRPALLDPEHRAMINYEIYFFSDDESLDRFHRDPLQYCGILTDPVSQARFRPSNRSPRWEHNGRPYFFESDSTLTRFLGMPDSFACRGGM
jgi:YHS domain-containing protein